jgi:hypothetical protein
MNQEGVGSDQPGKLTGGYIIKPAEIPLHLGIGIQDIRRQQTLADILRHQLNTILQISDG